MSVCVLIVLGSIYERASWSGAGNYGKQFCKGATE
jgi:hypothetical protein